MSELDASYSTCQRLARRAASNFFYSFLLLPREKRRAMCALYAFLRTADDLGDEPDLNPQDRRASLSALRVAVTGQGELGQVPGTSARAESILPAIRDTMARYQIPAEYLTAVIDGVEMDLADTRYDTFAQLEEYCYRVASVVGMSCIQIWGFRDPAAIDLARQCGIAFQLTNILRDLREDAQRGRVYLPREDLRRFEYTVEELERSEANARFIALMQFEIQRCERFYESAVRIDPLLSPDGRRVFRAMASTYRRLLEKIKLSPSDVLQRRIALGPWEKLSITARALTVSSPVI